MSYKKVLQKKLRMGSFFEVISRNKNLLSNVLRIKLKGYINCSSKTYIFLQQSYDRMEQVLR